jgi:hypothetical protein
MVSTNDLHYLTITEAAPLIRDGRLSPVELTRATWIELTQSMAD